MVKKTKIIIKPNIISPLLVSRHEFILLYRKHEDVENNSGN